MRFPVFVALTTCLLLAVSLSGQTFQGGLRGRVTDPAGASIATAHVQLVNQASNAKLESVTNDQGEYAFPSINPATYSLVIDHPGFKKHDRRDIVVATQSFFTIDVKLEVGDVSQSVQVTGEAGSDRRRGAAAAAHLLAGGIGAAHRRHGDRDGLR